MENPSKWHWGHFSNEIFCFKTGLSGLQEFQVASREIRLKPEGAAKSGHVSESSKVADGSLRFKVVVVSKSGFRASKMMDINVTTGEASILDKGATVLMIRIYQISQAEKSAKDPSRIMLIFFGDLNEPVDLIFQDRFTRDCFCELLTSLNPSIVFKFSQQQRNPNWISDKSVSLCMRCRKQFTMTLRKHHCRSCGFVICGFCSENSAILPIQGYDRPVRVCDHCFADLRSSRVEENMGITHKKSLRASIEYEPSSGNVNQTLFRKINSTRNSDPYHDRYGFPLKGRAEELISNHRMDDVTFQKNMSDLLKFERYYSLILEKQRTRWSKYLAFHPTIARDKELRLLVRKGIPPEMRGSIWQILCDTQSKRSQHDANYYSNLLSRANENGVGAANDIEKDLHRTFPTHSVYGTHKGVSILRSVLLAYSIRNPTVGYCQSMNFICAMLLLFMEEEDAFWMLACIVEDLTQVNGHYYYQADLVGARIDELVFKEIVKDRLPRINKKFDELEMAIEPLTINWFLCVFVNSVPLETTLRIWDVFFYDGSRALFRAGLALLRINEHLILQAQNSVQLMTFLKAFTRSALDCEVFIKACYEPFSMGTFSKHRIDEMRFEFMHHFGLQPTAQVFMAAEDEVSKREEFIETGHKLVLEDITESESSEESNDQNDRRIDMHTMDKKANSSPKLSPLFDQDSEPLLSEENSSTDIAHVDSKFADRFVGLQFLMSRLSFETNSLDCLSSPSERKISLNFSQGSSHRRRNSSLL